MFFQLIECCEQVPYKDGKPDDTHNLQGGIDSKVVAYLVVPLSVIICPEIEPYC